MLVINQHILVECANAFNQTPGNLTVDEPPLTACHIKRTTITGTEMTGRQ